MDIKTYSVWTQDELTRVSPKFESYTDLEIWLSVNTGYSSSKYKIVWK